MYICYVSLYNPASRLQDPNKRYYDYHTTCHNFIWHRFSRISAIII